MSPHSYCHTARWYEPSCSVRRQHQVKRLHRCGPRLMLEAFRQIEAGTPVDVVLESLCSLQPSDYAAVGADVLPIDCLDAVNGARK